MGWTSELRRGSKRRRPGEWQQANRRRTCRRSSSKSECLCRIEQDCNRPVVQQFHLHHLLELAGLTGQTGRPDAAYEILIELESLLSRSRGIERRAFATADVAVEGELGHYQHFSTNLSGGQVHFSMVIFEHTQTSNFIGQVIRVGCGIRRGYTEQNQKTASNLDRK